MSSRSLKVISRALLVLVLNLGAGWIVIGSWFPQDSIEVFSVLAFFLLSGIGAFWMVCAAIRCEAKPFVFVVLAFVPFAFLLYYFDHYRQRATTVS